MTAPLCSFNYRDSKQHVRPSLFHVTSPTIFIMYVVLSQVWFRICRIIQRSSFPCCGQKSSIRFCFQTLWGFKVWMVGVFIFTFLRMPRSYNWSLCGSVLGTIILLCTVAQSPCRKILGHCSETSLTGESQFYISTPLGIEPRSLMTGRKQVDHSTSGTEYESCEIAGSAHQGP